jgi:osmotically-inducible protein OsmY
MNARVALLALILAAAGALQGCVVPIVAAAGGATMVATDRRSVGVQLEDDRIESRIHRALDDVVPKNAMQVDVACYNRKCLLAGQVRTAQQRIDAEASAQKVENLGQLINELSVGDPDSLEHRADDTLISGKVKTALLAADGVPGGVVKTSVNSNVVYLFGKVTPSEGEAAATAASRVSGVRRVVKLFDLMTDQDLENLKKAREQSPSAAKGAQPN